MKLNAAVAAAPRPPRQRRSTGRVTLGDVARLAAVSQQTVSRVINTPDKATPETVRHVRAAIAQAGYQVPQAPTLPGRNRLVAALVPAINGAVFGETIEALSATLARAGYQLLLGECGYFDDDEDAVLANILSRQPDGIVLCRTLRSEAARRRLQASRLPVVETWEHTDAPVDMLIGFSHLDIGRAAARHLLWQGRRRPGMIAGDDRRADLRGQGYCETIAGFGLLDADFPEVPVVRIPVPGQLGAGRSGLTRLLQMCPQLDAVFCSTDWVALGVLMEARRLGIAVPGQLAVVGFGDIAFAAQTDPALTTIRVDGSLIGERAAQMIMRRAEGGTVERPVQDIGFSLVRRESG